MQLIALCSQVLFCLFIQSLNLPFATFGVIPRKSEPLEPSYSKPSQTSNTRIMATILMDMRPAISCLLPAPRRHDLPAASCSLGVLSANAHSPVVPDTAVRSTGGSAKPAQRKISAWKGYKKKKGTPAPNILEILDSKCMRHVRKVHLRKQFHLPTRGYNNTSQLCARFMLHKRMHSETSYRIFFSRSRSSRSFWSICWDEI